MRESDFPVIVFDFPKELASVLRLKKALKDFLRDSEGPNQ